MAKPNVIVDWVKRLDLPSQPLVAAQGSGVPGQAVVHLTGGAALLDLNDPRAGVWEGILDELLQANEPVYLETDPNTNLITRLLYPHSVVVSGIAQTPVGNLHEVELEISQSLHYLNTTNPDYHQLLTALQAARQHGVAVLVTETLENHEIIDVRPSSLPFVRGPVGMMMLPAGPSFNFSVAASIVTPQRAEQMFSLVANQSYIPFKYPDDGCWGRAHEMCRLIIANDVHPRKVWIYGRLIVSTRNNPQCAVRWGWHVAPTLLVDLGHLREINVIDPALFPSPVTQATWMGVQNDLHASIHDTDAAVFYRKLNGQATYDPTYSQTQQVLARFRRELALRTAQYGPPPYANCP